MKRTRAMGLPVEVIVIIATVLVCIAVVSLRLAS